MNTHLRDQLLWLASTTGLVQHEAGGVEVDISAVAKGGLVAGTGAGTMALQTVGTNKYVLTADSAQASGMAWTNGRMLLGGSTVAVGTTQSGTEVTVRQVTGLSIATTEPFLVVCSFDKDAAGAYSASLGLMVNAATGLRGAVQVTSATNQAEYGFAYMWVAPYLAASGIGLFLTATAVGASTPYTTQLSIGSAARPNATITSVEIRGLVSNIALTLAVREVFVWVPAT